MAINWRNVSSGIKGDFMGHAVNSFNKSVESLKELGDLKLKQSNEDDQILRNALNEKHLDDIMTTTLKSNQEDLYKKKVDNDYLRAFNDEKLEDDRYRNDILGDKVKQSSIFTKSYSDQNDLTIEGMKLGNEQSEQQVEQSKLNQSYKQEQIEKAKLEIEALQNGLNNPNNKLTELQKMQAQAQINMLQKQFEHELESKNKKGAAWDMKDYGALYRDNRGYTLNKNLPENIQNHLLNIMSNDSQISIGKNTYKLSPSAFNDLQKGMKEMESMEDIGNAMSFGTRHLWQDFIGHDRMAMMSELWLKDRLDKGGNGITQLGSGGKPPTTSVDDFSNEEAKVIMDKIWGKAK